MKNVARLIYLKGKNQRFFEIISSLHRGSFVAALLKKILKTLIEAKTQIALFLRVFKTYTL